MLRNAMVIWSISNAATAAYKFPIRHSQVEQKIDSAENLVLGVPETDDAAKQAGTADAAPSSTEANV